jgi:hypothetical protein
MGHPDAGCRRPRCGCRPRALLAVDHHRVAGGQAFEHLHLAVEAGLPERSGAKRSLPPSTRHTPTCLPALHRWRWAAAGSRAVAGSASVTSASSPTDRPAGGASKATMASAPRSRCRPGGSTRATRPGSGARTGSSAARSRRASRRQPGRAALVQPHAHPQRGRVDQPQHRLPGHHGAAGLGLAAGHHAVGRRQQAQVVALLLQPARSACSRCRSCRAAARFASAPATAASAEPCACTRASTAPALMKFCAPSST